MEFYRYKHSHCLGRSLVPPAPPWSDVSLWFHFRIPGFRWHLCNPSIRLYQVPPSFWLHCGLPGSSILLGSMSHQLIVTLVLCLLSSILFSTAAGSIAEDSIPPLRPPPWNILLAVVWVPICLLLLLALPWLLLLSSPH